MLLTKIIDEIVTSNQYLLTSYSSFDFGLNTGPSFHMAAEDPASLGSMITETLTPTTGSGTPQVLLINVSSTGEISYYTSNLILSGLSANETRSESIYLT